MSERTFRERVVERRGHKFIELKTGRLVGFYDMIGAAERARGDLTRACSRAYKLAVAHADPELADGDLERLEWFVENMQEWAQSMLKAIEDHRGVRTQEDRIALLRNTAGRTPTEAAAFRRKADELEAAMNANAR